MRWREIDRVGSASRLTPLDVTARKARDTGWSAMHMIRRGCSPKDRAAVRRGIGRAISPAGNDRGEGR
jgi:hypothetical protein